MWLSFWKSGGAFPPSFKPRFTFPLASWTFRDISLTVALAGDSCFLLISNNCSLLIPRIPLFHVSVSAMVVIIDLLVSYLGLKLWTDS